MASSHGRSLLGWSLRHRVPSTLLLGGLRDRVRVELAGAVGVMAAAAGLVTAVLAVVVPRVAALYSVTGVDLPVLTGWVMLLSELVVRGWPAFVALVLLGPCVVVAWRRTRELRLGMDDLLLATPVLGRLIRIRGLHGFSAALHERLRDGHCPVSAWTAALGEVGNEALARELSEGLRLTGLPSSAMGLAAPGTPAAQLLATGEETGDLSCGLGALTAWCRREEEAFLAVLRVVTEPLVILGLGLGLGTIIIALYLPLFKVAQSVGH